MLYDFFSNQKVDLNIEKCIIIGNSGNVLNHKKGDEINKYNTIIRLNDSKIKRYKKFVGNRTDIRICAHNAVKNLNKIILKDDIILIIWGVKMHINKIYNHVIKIKKENPKLKIYKLTNDFINYNYLIYKKYTNNIRPKTLWLSTGWFSIFFALLYTKLVTIYGFGFLNKKNCKYHYYDNRNGLQNEYFRLTSLQKGHKFNFESKIFTDLINKKILSIL